MGGGLKNGRFGFCRAAIFLWRGGRALLQGVLAKDGVLTWRFCGEVVVGRCIIVVLRRHVSCV
jgi:hypothetical protein